MPYPESCPECNSTFRNTGTHFTARRNEVGRHVLLELGCQTTSRRFWWNFTTGQLAGVTTTPETRPSLATSAQARVLATACAASNGHAAASNGHASNGSLASTGHATASNGSMASNGHAGNGSLASNGHAAVGNGSLASNGSGSGNGYASTPRPALINASQAQPANGSNGSNGHSVLASVPLSQPTTPQEKPAVHSAATPSRSNSTPNSSSTSGFSSNLSPAPASTPISEAAPPDSSALREAFLRQLQLDRLTMRQMRGWLMAEEARRAAEVAGSATEATYERLALALFGVDLPQLLGRAAAVPPSTAMSAEERLELQREKARIRARQRRAAIKAARLARED